MVDPVVLAWFISLSFLIPKCLFDWVYKWLLVFGFFGSPLIEICLFHKLMNCSLLLFWFTAYGVLLLLVYFWSVLVSWQYLVTLAFIIFLIVFLLFLFCIVVFDKCVLAIYCRFCALKYVILYKEKQLCRTGNVAPLLMFLKNWFY